VAHVLRYESHGITADFDAMADGNGDYFGLSPERFETAVEAAYQKHIASLKPAPRAEAEQIIDRFFSRALDHSENVRADPSLDMFPAEIRHFFDRSSPPVAVTRMQKALATRDPGELSIEKPMLTLLLASKGLGIPEAEADRAALMRYWHRAAVATMDFDDERDQGLYPNDRARLEASPTAWVAAPAGAQSDDARTASAVTLQNAWEEFANECRPARRWTEKTDYQYHQTFELFGFVCSKVNVADVDKSDAASFKVALADLPPSYGKGKKLKIRDGVLPKRAPGAPGLSAATINKHLTAMNSFFEWAVNHDYASKNVFEKLHIRDTKKPSEERPAWSPEDIRTILASPLYTGCKSARQRHLPGDQIIKDARYWVPLIGMYSGMRLEEICQLPPQDVRLIEGIWCCDICPGEGKQLKSDAATRLVPIHAELIRLGFLDFVDEQGKVGKSRIFEELRAAAFDKFSDQVGKWFGRFRKEQKARSSLPGS
jgi:site-specific recombinase XerD